MPLSRKFDPPLQVKSKSAFGALPAGAIADLVYQHMRQHKVDLFEIHFGADDTRDAIVLTEQDLFENFDFLPERDPH